MKEIWKKIPSYENSYEASNFGRIRSVDRFVNCKNGKIRLHKGRVLNAAECGKYLAVNLCVNGKPKSNLVHRLVVAAFCGLSDLDVNHIDFNTHNNRIDNLEYCTRKENLKHSANKGRTYFQKNLLNGKRKLNVFQVLTILTMPKQYNKNLMQSFGTCVSNINTIRRRVTWSDKIIKQIMEEDDELQKLRR